VVGQAKVEPTVKAGLEAKMLDKSCKDTIEGNMVKSWAQFATDSKAFLTIIQARWLPSKQYETNPMASFSSDGQRSEKRLFKVSKAPNGYHTQH
jgi:hypothetical protein